MLNTHMMQEIIDLKLQGYTPAGIRDYYEAQGIKPPSMPTIRVYTARSEHCARSNRAALPLTLPVC